MPQKPFVLRVHFYTVEGTGTHSLASGAHHAEYMGSPDKGELLVDTRSSLASAAIHAQYAGEREGSLGYFGPMADHPQEAQQTILHAQGPVWRMIASVGEEDALNMGGALITKAGWETATQPVVAKMITELGLDPPKVQWIAAVHRHQHHENNPHVHLLLWEHGEPSRKTGEWNKKALKAIKQQWVSQLYQPERAQLGQEKTTVRAEIRDTVKTLLTPVNGQQACQKALSQRLQTLGQMLPGKGRLAYAYMPQDVKHAVEDLIRGLWTQDPALQAQHDRYLWAAEQMTTFYWHVDDDQSHDVQGRDSAIQKARQNAEADLIQRVATDVLKAAHTEAWRTQWQSEHETLSAMLPDDTIRRVMHGKLSLPELVATTPALRQLRQETVFRISEPFSEPSHRRPFAGTIYHPSEPAASRFPFPFPPEGSEKSGHVSRFQATPGTPLSSQAPRPRTWTFVLPEATAQVQPSAAGDRILATPFDLVAVQKRQDQTADRFIRRLDNQVHQLAWERGLMASHPRRGLIPHLHAVLMRVMQQAERDAVRTATWLAESQYQRQRAERAMARNTGQEITG